MADTKIEWADKVWNFIAGCSLESPGCTHCYAMTMAARVERMNPELAHYQGLTQPSKAGPVWTGKIGIAGDATFLAPLRWKKPARIFVNSMSDLFHPDVPREIVDRAFAVMAIARQHTFMVLTKRSARMREYFSQGLLKSRIAVAIGRIDPGFDFRHFQWPLSNTWLGVSVEDQKRADDRIPDLLATPAAVRWISAEPLLAPVDLHSTKGGTLWIGGQRGCGGAHQHGGNPEKHSHTDHPDNEYQGNPSHRHHHHDERCRRGLDLVVAGMESGEGARYASPDIVRALRDQCVRHGVAFHFKQWGSWLPGDEAQEENGSGLFIRFPNGDERHINSDGDDIMIGAAQDHRGAPKHLWKNYWASGDGRLLRKVGKHTAGRMLDGRTWDEMPA